MMTEGREVDPDQITHHVVHPALHQDYVSNFRSWRATDIAPTLTSPILVVIASSMPLPERPMMPEGPETPKATEGLQGGGKALVLQTAFYWFFAVSGPFTSFLVLHTISWVSRSEVCAFVWGIFARGLRVETFVRVLRSSRVVL